MNGSFFVNTANDAPGAFSLSSPQDNGVVTIANPTLEVTNSVDLDGDALSYAFEVFADSSLTTLVASVADLAPGTSGTTAWQVDTALTDNTQYYWRATVTDENGAATQSPVGIFLVNTANQAPGLPAIASPAVGSEVLTQDVTLTVTNATDPEGDALVYYFELDTVNTFDSPTKQASTGIAEGVSTTAWLVTGLADNTTYYWRARASDGNAQSGWVQGSFFVNTANDAPSVPVLKNPGRRGWRRPQLSLRTLRRCGVDHAG